MINERLLFTSWRKVASFRFRSLICSTLKAMGLVCRAICRIISQVAAKASRDGMKNAENGASEGIRTLDTHVGNVMLYQAELRSLPENGR